ncbi:ATP-binding cassette sub-family A member 3 [Exaiptasia diaphana]|nr:ATP-binding cassette sub-family A member 3 [Exaiptasia diaphana]
MADGQLRCCGSSLFLKSRYGVGYHLTLVKKEGFNENIAINAIKRVVPSAEILSNVGAELELVLNRDAAKSFESLFLDLETKKEEYGIASFGVSVTTMEEVFIKVGEGSEKTVEDIAIDHHQHRDTDNIIEMSNNGEPIMGELLKGLPLKWQQYKAMLMKRFLNSKLLVPLFLILFGLLIANINFLSSNGKEPPRVLCLSNLSTDDSNVLAYYADFHQPEKDFKVARDFLKSIRVDAEDILDDVKAIHLGNMNNSIEVKGRKYTYTTPTKNKTTACCQYQFLILNKKCKSDFMSKSLTSDTCSKNKNFGYTKCKEQNCLLSNWCPDSLENTNLDDMNVYFSEYVLEKSNNKDYFKKHVAGFTFGHAHNIKNVHTSNNVTNTTKSVVVMPDTNSTVWYSNKV